MSAVTLKITPSKSSYIHLEGLPGAGKSTWLTQLIQRDRQCVLIPDLLNPKIYKGFNISIDFILDAERIKSRLMRYCLPQHMYLQERGYLSALAYHYSQDQLASTTTYQPLLQTISKLIDQGEIIIPDLIIIADVDLELARFRKHQGEVTYKIWRDPVSLQIIYRFYLDYFQNPLFKERVVVVDFNAQPPTSRSWIESAIGHQRDEVK